MLLLPAAAFCCLCSALVSMAADLVQDDASLTRTVGGNVSFSCGGIQQCGEQYVYWYQKKDKETFRVILDINKNNGDIDKSYSSHPQKDEFSSVKTSKGWELEIKTVTEDHSATYYCSCWSHSERFCELPVQKPAETRKPHQLHVSPPSQTPTHSKISEALKAAQIQT